MHVSILFSFVYKTGMNIGKVVEALYRATARKTRSIGTHILAIDEQGKK